MNRQLIATRKTQIIDNTQRANKADISRKDLEYLLSERKKTVEDLEKQVELMKQRNRLNEGLLDVLQKLDDTRKKLALVEEKEKSGDRKIQLLNEEVNSSESRYRETKKVYDELLREMESLGLNS